MLNVNQVRRDFPIFGRKIRGWDLVFLDSAASSQKPKVLIDRIAEIYGRSYANIHRGVYVLSMESTQLVEQARERVAAFFGASSGYVPVFVRGTTEALNLVAWSCGQAEVRAGDEILLTEMEHHANLVPWQQMAARAGAVLKFARVTPEGRLDLDHFYSLVGERTKVAAFTHASNVLGTVNPVAEMVARLRERGVITVVDGAQAAAGMPVSVADIGCHAYALSAHKMLGPTGVGVLFLEKRFAKDLPPYQTGGGAIRKVDFDKTLFAPAPEKFEPGTPAFVEIAAFPAALDYLDALGMDRVLEHERALAGYAIRRLQSIEGLRLFGPLDTEDRLGVVSFELDDVHAHDLGMFLDFQGICVRVGHHCAQPLMRKLGTTATTRASMYVYNDPRDIDRLVGALREAKDYFRKSRSRGR